MRTLDRIASSLSQFSRALAPTHVTTSHCKHCGDETRCLVNFARGTFRCLECGAHPQDAPSEEPLHRARQR